MNRVTTTSLARVAFGGVAVISMHIVDSSPSLTDAVDGTANAAAECVANTLSYSMIMYISRYEHSLTCT